MTLGRGNFRHYSGPVEVLAFARNPLRTIEFLRGFDLKSD